MSFLRTSGHNKIKLGYGKSKRKQKWRKERGRHNKIREKRKGRIRKVEIGYRTAQRTRDTVDGKKPIFISNLADVQKVKKHDLVIIASIGRKKRMEIEAKIKEIEAKIINERRKK